MMVWGWRPRRYRPDAGHVARGGGHGATWLAAAGKGSMGAVRRRKGDIALGGRRSGALAAVPSVVPSAAPANLRPAPVVLPDRSSGGEVRQSEPSTGSRLDEEKLAPLVERARTGDAGAFEEIVRMMQGPVRSFARRMMRDAHLGDDAAQEVFLRM